MDFDWFADPAPVTSDPYFEEKEVISPVAAPKFCSDVKGVSCKLTKLMPAWQKQLPSIPDKFDKSAIMPRLGAATFLRHGLRRGRLVLVAFFVRRTRRQKANSRDSQ